MQKRSLKDEAPTLQIIDAEAQKVYEEHKKHVIRDDLYRMLSLR